MKEPDIKRPSTKEDKKPISELSFHEKFERLRRIADKPHSVDRLSDHHT